MYIITCYKQQVWARFPEVPCLLTWEMTSTRRVWRDKKDKMLTSYLTHHIKGHSFQHHIWLGFTFLYIHELTWIRIVSTVELHRREDMQCNKKECCFTWGCLACKQHVWTWKQLTISLCIICCPALFRSIDGCQNLEGKGFEKQPEPYYGYSLWERMRQSDE